MLAVEHIWPTAFHRYQSYTFHLEVYYLTAIAIVISSFLDRETSIEVSESSESTGGNGAGGDQ